MALQPKNWRKIPAWIWMTVVFVLSLLLIIMVLNYYNQRIEDLNKIIEK